MKFSTINPATEETVSSYTAASEKEVEETVLSAKKAFEVWKKTSFSERAALLKKVSELLVKRKEALGKIMSMEMGKPIKEGIAEVEKSAWLFDYYAENAEKFLANEIVATDAKKSYISFEPYGVIGAIMPWNFPVWQVSRFVSAALAAGNCIIVKHSSVCAQSGIELEKIFLDAGFPKGVYQNLVGTGQTAEMLIASNIDGVTFTGSTEIGKKVALTSAGQLKKFILELGGNDAFIVLKDADISAAAKGAIKGRMKNTGQSCIAAKRFFVEKEVADEFTKKVIEEFKKMRIGDPLDSQTEVGPLANKQQFETIVRQVDESVKKGAKVLLGGKRWGKKGFFYEPTVLGNIKPDMPVAREEVFGPVIPIIPVKDEQEAIKKANDSEFGLGASIWSKDTEKAERIAKELVVGAVCINTAMHSDPRLPFGGTKKSGFGREMSRYGLLEFMNLKAIKVH